LAPSRKATPQEGETSKEALISEKLLLNRLGPVRAFEDGAFGQFLQDFLGIHGASAPVVPSHTGAVPAIRPCRVDCAVQSSYDEHG
jgi:hypothetical protein